MRISRFSAASSKLPPRRVGLREPTLQPRQDLGERGRNSRTPDRRRKNALEHDGRPGRRAARGARRAATRRAWCVRPSPAAAGAVCAAAHGYASRARGGRHAAGHGSRLRVRTGFSAAPSLRLGREFGAALGAPKPPHRLTARRLPMRMTGRDSCRPPICPPRARLARPVPFLP